ncbi:MAG: hypothetical protein GXO09_00950 [Crenarchaeota archaeon]|nr:hypothetical protein [Thermoproteota archaeon]
MPGRTVVEGVRGGAWMTGVSLTVALVGFIYWLVMARMAGLHALGVAASVISGAGVASSLAGAGLGLAIIASVAAGSVGFWGFMVYSLLVSLVGGFAALVLAAPLGGYGSIAFALAFLGLLSACLLNVFVASKRFRGYFAIGLVSAFSRLAVGVALVVLGMGVVGILAGYLAPSVVTLAAAAPLVVVLWREEGLGSRGFEGVGRLASLHAANYPYGFSQQLALMLTVYAYAVSGGIASSVGSLYLLLMIELVLVSLPFSTAVALIPVSMGASFEEAYREAYRVTAAASLLAASLLLAAPSRILSLISSRLASSSTLLPALLLSMTPVMHVQLAVTWLNRRGDRRGVALVGASRLAALVLLLALLLHTGVRGVLAAWILANLLAAVVGAALTSTMRLLASLTALNTLLLLSYIPTARLILPLLVLLAAHFSGIAEIREMLEMARLVTGWRRMAGD